MSAEVLGDKYELVRMLGEGGMGSVWEARNRVTGKRVAVKRMSHHLVGNTEATERFLREARAATRIEHPNVVQIFDVGVHDGAPFMVMEFLEGEPLSALRSRLGAIEARALVELLTPVMLALDATHALGIVHRDLKPDNIYLTKRGARLTPKLLDFGISKVLGETDLKLTRTGTVMGTPYYMAPEQASGRKDLDHRADVYAIGVIFYEGLTGKLPFDADNYNALIVAILTADANSVAALRGDVPVAVSDAIAAAMKRDPNERIGSIAELARRLGDAVGLPDLWAAHPDSAPVPVAARAHSFAATLPAGSASALTPGSDASAPSTKPPLTTMSRSAREVSVPPAPPTSNRAWIGGGIALATVVATSSVVMLVGAGRHDSPPSSVASVETSPTSSATSGGGSSRTARALACAAEGQDRCVVDVLSGHDDTETDAALLVDALRRMGDSDTAVPLARAYVTRWPQGSRAVEYATWLAERSRETLPSGRLPPETMAPPEPTTARGHRTRTISEHTPVAEAEDRAAVAAPPLPPPSTETPAATGRDTHRSGSLGLEEF